ncbi:galactokinase family protein [Acidicapsa ligni]|uniref:galactokinase family protein n=1 Tax=Acidicapsa ligni TaxID=542300 RepID=UPI0037BF9D58
MEHCHYHYVADENDRDHTLVNLIGEHTDYTGGIVLQCGFGSPFAELVGSGCWRSDGIVNRRARMMRSGDTADLKLCMAASLFYD